MPTNANVLELKVQLLAKKFLKILDEPNATLDIFLLPNAEIKALKARFIKKQTEPNVLAFPEPRQFPHPELSRPGRRTSGPAKKYLGEVYLNQDILTKSPERIAPLLLHGILHLLGYDHKKNADAKKMEALEAKILTKM